MIRELSRNGSTSRSATAGNAPHRTSFESEHYHSKLVDIPFQSAPLPYATKYRTMFQWYLLLSTINPHDLRSTAQSLLSIHGAAVDYVSGMNLYLYGASSPLVYTDPLGLDIWVDIVRWIGPDSVLKCTGGPQHIPGLDQGPTQSVIVTACNVVSTAAPAGGIVRIVTCGPKALRMYKHSSTVIRRTHLDRIRKYIRYDRPHHGKPAQWDGEIPNWFR